MTSPTRPSVDSFAEKLALDVAAWRRSMNLPMPEAGLPTPEVDEADASYIQEEVEELVHAVRVRKDLPDMMEPHRIRGFRVEEMDAICDILFATLSYAMRRYTPAHLGACYAAVCAANGRKVGGPVREDGKQLKPEGWVGPEEEIGEVLG